MLDRFFERYYLHAREARFVRIALLLTVSINVLTWILALWFAIPRLTTTPFFALHYTIYFGVDRIGEPWRLLGLPLLGLVIAAVNVTLAIRHYQKDRLASAFVMLLSLLFEGLLLFVTFLTVLLNL